MGSANRWLKNGAVVLSVFLLADDPSMAQSSNSEIAAVQQRAAIRQAKSSDELDQQYQVDQQLLQLDRQKLRDGKTGGADAQTLHALRQTVDAAQARLDADFNRLSSLHQSPQFIKQEALGYHLLQAADQRKRLQYLQEQRLKQEKQAKEKSRRLEEQKSQQQTLLVQQQQLLIAQQQNLLAAEQQTQNQAFLNGGYYYPDFGVWPMDVSGWSRRRGNTAISSGKKPVLNRSGVR